MFNYQGSFCCLLVTASKYYHKQNSLSTILLSFFRIFLKFFSKLPTPLNVVLFVDVKHYHDLPFPYDSLHIIILWIFFVKRFNKIFEIFLRNFSVL